MSFPPHDVLQAQLMFYRLQGIADAVNEAIAGTGLKAEVGYTPELLHYVRVPLENGGAVTLAAGTRYPGAWLIVWPTKSPLGHNQMAWPLDMDPDALVTIFAAAVDNAVHGCDLPSPFSWGRTDKSTIVELADRLLARGVERGALHLEPLRTMDDDGQPRAMVGDLDELRITDKSDADRTLAIRLDEQHGWAVDQIMSRTGGSGRLDLASALGLRTAVPRVGADEVDLEGLTQVLIEDTFWVDVVDADQRHLRRYGPTPEEAHVRSREDAARAATAWLRWAGFGGPAARWTDGALTAAVEVHVDYAEKQVGLAGVQRYGGIAAVNGHTPVVIARSGFSRNARAWAGAAGMLLFRLGEDGDLRPDNALAAAYTPTEIGRRPADCDDRACLTFGCVLDDELCASNWGRYSDPNAERLRL